MKKCYYFMLVALTAVMLSSCGGSSDKPSVVAEKFLNHLGKKEFADAKKLATEESAASIDMLETLGKSDESDAKAKKIESVTCKEDGDKATCDYKEDGESKTLDLVKKDGKWLVEMKKESPDSNSESTTDGDSKTGDNASEGNEETKSDKKEAASSSDCEQFLKDYEAFANSYIKVLKKYKANPTDMTIMGEYTEMAQKASEMDAEGKDCTDAVYAGKVAAIAARIATAAAGM